MLKTQVRLPGSRPSSCHLLSVLPWARRLTFLGLSLSRKSSEQHLKHTSSPQLFLQLPSSLPGLLPHWPCLFHLPSEFLLRICALSMREHSFPRLCPSLAHVHASVTSERPSLTTQSSVTPCAPLTHSFSKSHFLVLIIKKHFYSHFTDVATEAQRAEILLCIYLVYHHSVYSFTTSHPLEWLLSKKEGKGREGGREEKLTRMWRIWIPVHCWWEGKMMECWKQQ